MQDAPIEMPILANPRREKFAQEVASGKSMTEAYEAAGYKPNRKNAQRLRNQSDVSSRIEELQSRGAERAEVTLESLLSEAEEARVAAMGAGQFAAAVSAIREKGILSGKRVEKSEVNQKRKLDELSYDELVRIAAQGSSGAPSDFDPGRAVVADRVH
jgi:phage terminase small subunit